MLQHPPGEVPGDELQDQLVLCELADDVAGHEQHLLFKSPKSGRLQGIEGPLQDLAGLVAHQLVPKVILVLKVEVEGSLCHPGVLCNVRHGGLGESLAGKQVKSRAQQRFPLLFFVFFRFSNPCNHHPRHFLRRKSA